MNSLLIKTYIHKKYIQIHILDLSQSRIRFSYNKKRYGQWKKKWRNHCSIDWWTYGFAFGAIITNFFKLEIKWAEASKWIWVLWCFICEYSSQHGSFRILNIHRFVQISLSIISFGINIKLTAFTQQKKKILGVNITMTQRMACPHIIFISHLSIILGYLMLMWKILIHIYWKNLYQRMMYSVGFWYKSAWLEQS